MKLTLPTLSPRNPVAVAARRRAGGAHRPAAPRQQAQRALRRELDALARPSP